MPHAPLSLNESGTEAVVRLDRVGKGFAGVAALTDVSLDIGKGEFLTLLGPSGCGKTTTLRLINGFEVPDAGTVFIDGKAANAIPPYHRNVNTVFQNYALFPHLTVKDNIAYGLSLKKVPTAEINRRVAEMMERVGVADKAMRLPRQLSGGQMQRVALARALINEPKVLLLDEPLGALDAKLRRAMQIELRRMHKDLGITFICVTHDQEEALVMSDRIAVMNEGRVAQIGSPGEIFQRPANCFVADFIGGSNFIAARTGSAGQIEFADESSWRVAGLQPGQDLIVAVRPSRLMLAKYAPAGAFTLRADLEDLIYLGDTCRLILRGRDGGVLISESASRNVIAEGLIVGTGVDLAVDFADVSLFGATGARLSEASI